MSTRAATDLVDLAQRVLQAVGFSPASAETIARALVEADVRGVHSHGLMLLPLYVERVEAGLVTTAEGGEVVVDRAASAVIDAQRAAGQLVANQAMRLAIDKARTAGAGIVTVRRSNHFGAASAYVERAAAVGMIGLAASNTTPLMPAPGGAEALVGNNPLAIAVPRRDDAPLVLDMALSAVAGGKIRYAANAGQRIPAGWATDVRGIPTDDPAAALEGLLLPMAGHKGFGLALMVDLLTGGLSGGATGGDVRSIYRDREHPNDCSHLLVAIDPASYAGEDALLDAADSASASVHGSATAPGAGQPMVPGEPERRAAAEAATAGVRLEDAVLASVLATASRLGVETGEHP